MERSSPVIPRWPARFFIVSVYLGTGVLVGVPSDAYDGIFETIEQAARSLNGASTKPAESETDTRPPSAQLTGPAIVPPTYEHEISKAQADRMRDYSRPQTAMAIYNLLGQPTWQDGAIDIYQIAGTDDGVYAGRRLIVDYESGRAVAWRIQ
jgi:hypothetical protein